MTDDTSRPDPSQGPAHDLAVFDDLVADERICMFTTVTADGDVHSRPMAVQRRDGNTLWFFSFSDAPKVAHLAAHPGVGLVFVDSGTWVSVSGTGSVVDDVAMKRELWNPFAASWLQCEPEDPKVGLLRVDLTGGEYWDSPSGPAKVVSLAKVALGQRPAEGDNAKLDLA